MQYFDRLAVSQIADSWYRTTVGDGHEYLFNSKSGSLCKLPESAPDRLNSLIQFLATVPALPVTEPAVESPNHEASKIPRLMMFLTPSCNLRCIYCHCNSTRVNTRLSTSDAIKIVARYLKHIGDFHGEVHRIQITFMGGGEPFLGIRTIRAIVEYVKKLAGSGEYSIVTNGTLGSDKDWSWLVDNQFRITISADGPPRIQDIQRPYANPRGSSSKKLEARFRFLADEGAQIHVRSTVLKTGHRAMRSIVEYFEQFPAIHTNHLEPASFSGRGSSLAPESTFLYDEFFRNYSIYLFADPKRYKSSWFFPFRRASAFCGASQYNAIVTHDEVISLCSEVDSKARGTAIGDKYLVSQISDVSPFRSERAERFSTEHNVELLPECRSCVLKYKCGGGCYIKRDRDFRGETSFYEAYCENAIRLNMSYLIGAYEHVRAARGVKESISGTAGNASDVSQGVE